MHKQIRFRNRSFDICLRDSADDSVVAEIFNWQEYRAVEVIIQNTKLPILDVGAHIGIFTLYVKALNPGAKIYALEPEKENFALFKQNLKLNAIEDVKIFQTALAGSTGTRNLVKTEDHINYYLYDDTVEKEESISLEKIKAITLEDFMNQGSLEEAGLLKMDIEGGEYEVFEKMDALTFSKIKNIYLEFHNYRGRSYKEIEKTLREHGFSVQIFPSRFEKDLGFLFARNKRGD